MPYHADISSGVAPKWKNVTYTAGAFVTPGVCIGFYVPTGGNVSFVSHGETIIAPFLEGTFVTASVQQINQTNTTATGLCALYI